MKEEITISSFERPIDRVKHSIDKNLKLLYDVNKLSYKCQKSKVEPDQFRSFQVLIHAGLTMAV